MPGTADTRARIDQFLIDAKLSTMQPTIVRLTGDASDRQYHRVMLRGAPSQILSVYPGPLDVETLPFVNVSRLLSQMPLPAPMILHHSGPLGILALEDLGDTTLQERLLATDPDARLELYKEAVKLIDTLQRRGRDLVSTDYLPYGLQFDEDKLTWELEFFTTHFLQASRGCTLTDATRTALRREYASIAEELAAEPRVLCHRDYHSRNLMWHEGRLAIIDFQDARMGPDTYDLASLLRDSYVDIEHQQVEALIDWFLSLRAASATEDGDFRRRFDLMALQRNLKALGTFGFQATARGNSSYLRYVPRTLAYVRPTLTRYPRFGVLHDLLATHLDELR